MITSLPQPVQNYFNAVKQAINDKPEDKKNKIAWEITKSKFKKVENSWVAKSSDFDLLTTVHYQFAPNEVSIMKSDDGYSTIDYVLSGNNVDNDNQSFDDFALKCMTTQINEEGLVGRLGEDFHEFYKQLIREGKTPDEIEEILQSQETGIKAINAKYENGRMIAKLQVKNDLLGKVLKYKGASIEARIPSESIVGGKFKQARAVGFVFTDKPANPITGLALS